MKFRHKGSSGNDKIELQMTPMIDIVFQLLVFFIMTFQVVDTEGDFSIRMPLSAPTQQIDEPPTTTIKVIMKADGEEGDLSSLRVKAEGKTLEMNGSTAKEKYRALFNEVLKQTGDVGQGPQESAKMTEVEFDCDDELKYIYVVKAIEAVSGYNLGHGNNKRTVKLIEKIKFAAPKGRP